MHGSTNTFSPTVLVVDDQMNALKVRMMAFEELGCAPVGAKSLGEALLKIRSNPGIGLVATDINFDLHRPGNRDGVKLTKELRAWLPEMPIVAVSTLIDEHSMASQERSLFDDFYLKGERGNITDKIPAWREKAIHYLNSRPSRALEELERLREKYKFNESDFQLMREFIPVAAAPEKTGYDDDGTVNAVPDQSIASVEESAGAEAVESQLAALGYTLKIIEANGLSKAATDENLQLGKAIAVWVRLSGSQYIVELYGFPQLYAHGISEHQAIDQLLFLMSGYHEDFKAGGRSTNSNGMQRLHDYLQSIFS